EERFRFPETVREYALERLAGSGDAEAVRERHAAHFAEMAERTAPELERPGAAAGLERLEAELDNFRAALRWCEQSGDAAMGLRCAASLHLFWLFRGDRGEGLSW